VSPSIRVNDSRRVNASRNELEAIFASDAVIRRPDRSHLGFVVTPEKYEQRELHHLGTNSVIYSPREVFLSQSPKPSIGC